MVLGVVVVIQQMPQIQQTNQAILLMRSSHSASCYNCIEYIRILSIIIPKFKAPFNQRPESIYSRYASEVDTPVNFIISCSVFIVLNSYSKIRMIQLTGFEPVYDLTRPCSTGTTRTIRERYWITVDLTIESMVCPAKQGVKSRVARG